MFAFINPGKSPSMTRPKTDKKRPVRPRTGKKKTGPPETRKRAGSINTTHIDVMSLNKLKMFQFTFQESIGKLLFT